MQPLPPPVHLEAETKATLVPSSETCGNNSPNGFDVLVPFGFGVYTTVSRSRNSRSSLLVRHKQLPPERLLRPRLAQGRREVQSRSIPRGRKADKGLAESLYCHQKCGSDHRKHRTRTRSRHIPVPK